MHWKRVLAYITGSVDQALLLCHEYLVTEYRILRQQLPGRVQLSDIERRLWPRLARMGKKALEEVASIVKPATILAWHLKLVAAGVKCVVLPPQSPNMTARLRKRWCFTA